MQRVQLCRWSASRHVLFAAQINGWKRTPTRMAHETTCEHWNCRVIQAHMKNRHVRYFIGHVLHLCWTFKDKKIKTLVLAKCDEYYDKEACHTYE